MLGFRLHTGKRVMASNRCVDVTVVVEEGNRKKEFMKPFSASLFYHVRNSFIASRANCHAIIVEVGVEGRENHFSRSQR